MSGRRKKQRFAAEERKRRRQFTAEERKRALEDLAAGKKPGRVADGLGCSREILRLWRKAAEADGTMPVAQRPPVVERKKRKAIAPATPTPAGQDRPTTTDVDQAIVAAAPAATGSKPAPLVGPSQLGAAEIEAILRYKKRHPSMGPAQIGAQLKRFHGWRTAVRAIGRVLVNNGYKLEHRGSRPEGDEDPLRWEAPHRNAIWQLDFAELFLVGERRQLLIIEDDFSRFIVGHRLVEHPTSEVVVEVMRDAIRRHGKPESVYTDRGGAFLAWGDRTSFGDFSTGSRGRR
jgi:transposase-like protein